MRRAKKTVRSWKQAQALLEQWRRDLANINVELKRPRVIDVVPIDFVSGELVERDFTNADVTVRRSSGAILVIDNYEIAAISDGKKRFEPV